jgi:hypothetical protein
MKSYSSGLDRTAMYAIVVATVVLSSVFAVSMIVNDFPTPTTTNTIPTTTPTTPTTLPENGYGVRAADYLNSRRDDVMFYWLSNCTLVGNNLMDYYQSTDPGFYMDAVYMWGNTSTGVDIQLVVWDPWGTITVDQGTCTDIEWGEMNGALIDDGLAQMSDATTHPEDWIQLEPFSLWCVVYFDDNSFLMITYSEPENLVALVNGTWSGTFFEDGQPNITGYSEEIHWLIAEDHLVNGMEKMYTTITEAVP